jgi:DNA helicase-2/ATP-dependent DNA helicase PcrA
MQNIKMLFGAPGCGKTSKLIEKLGELLKEYQPNEIAYVSFTKKGSYEGRDRAIKEFSQYTERDFPYFRTIHSLAFRSIGASMYGMVSKKDYKNFSKALGMNFLGYYTSDLVNNDDKYLAQVSLEKNNTASAKVALEDLEVSKFEYVKMNYEHFKKEIGVMDFDDLVMQFIKEDKSIPVKVAIIDEAQDLTTLQWQFCEVAFRGCEKVYIAGDDDQAIYEWSGADVNYFLELTKSSSVYILKKSYRLKKNLLQFSKTISQQIQHRVEKDFNAVSEEQGGIYFYNNLEDIPVNNEETYYFLSRNNYWEYHLSIRASPL